MLSKDEIIAAIGPEQYKEACEVARKEAPGTGTKRSRNELSQSSVPHGIGDLIWGRWFHEPQTRHNDDEKIELIFQIYQDMPCYSLMQDIAMRYPGLSPEAKQVFWKHARALLSQEDEALADPITYSIWCNYFEHPDMIEEAWAGLTQDLSNTKLLQRMLSASGPVPFRLKEALYAQLIHDKAWHLWIYTSLLGSRFDFFGKINVPKARELLKQLDLPADTPSLPLLREMLEQDEDVPEALQPQIKHTYGMQSKLIFPDKDATAR